jgi:hypothetical protein
VLFDIFKHDAQKTGLKGTAKATNSYRFSLEEKWLYFIFSKSRRKVHPKLPSPQFNTTG